MINRRNFLSLGLGVLAVAAIPGKLSAIDFRETKPKAWTATKVDEAIKEIFGSDVIEVYSTGFNSEKSGVFVTTFEIDPDLKELVNKAKLWIKANKP